MKVLALSLLVFLSSCAGSIKVTGSGCQAFNATYMDINKSFSPQHVWEKKVWTSGGGEDDQVTFTLKDLLDEKDLKCKQVKLVRYEVSQNFMDQLFSIIPFKQRMTLKIEVETKS